MHTNPIAHWATLGPVAPLLDWDFRTPVEQPHPASSAGVVALGLPAPTVLYNCQEAAGNITDKVGAIDLVAAVGPYQGQRAVGLYWNGDYTGTQKLAVEGVNGSTNKFAAALAASLDTGMNSFAFWLEFRCKRHLMSVTRSIFGKMVHATTTGYRIRISNAGALTFNIGDGALSNTATVTSTSFTDGDWHRVLVVCDRVAGRIYIYSDLGNNNVVITAGNLDNAAFFSMLAVEAQTGFAGQISEIIGWIGASAVGMGQAHFDALNLGSSNPNAVPFNIATHASQISDLVGYNPGFGVFLGEFSPNHLPIAFDAGMTDLGLGCWRAATSLLAESDKFDTTWAVSGTAVVSGLFTNLDVSPRGMWEAYKMTVAAGVGAIRHNTVTAGNTVYTFDVFVKRHNTMGADVNCQLNMIDVTHGGASIGVQAFTATAIWQRVTLRVSTIAGQISTDWRIEILDAAGAIALCRATVRAGEIGPPIYRVTSVGSLALTDYELTNAAPSMAPGVYIKGAQGEIELTFKCARDNALQRHMLSMVSVVAGGDRNAHDPYVDNVTNHLCEVYDSANNLNHLVIGSALNMVLEWTMVYRWKVSGLPSGNTSEVTENGGAPIAGSVAAWPVASTVDYLLFGMDPTGSRHLDGLISRIRIWEQPR